VLVLSPAWWTVLVLSPAWWTVLVLVIERFVCVALPRVVAQLANRLSRPPAPSLDAKTSLAYASPQAD
jgi:hypothetical protein